MRNLHKLSPFHDTLEQALKADSFRAKHNRRSAKALFEQIKAEDYDGGYSQLTAFIYLPIPRVLAHNGPDLWLAVRR